MFLLDISCIGHLNVKVLKLLKQITMVQGLLDIEQFCEACVFAKQSKKSFLTCKAWRDFASHQLIQANLCGPEQSP